MKLEDQVCRFAQGVILKERGVEARPQFYWYEKNNGFQTWIELTNALSLNHTQKKAPAYTSSELGVLLSGYQVIKLAFNNDWLVIDKYGTSTVHKILSIELEVHAKASALIWLIKNDFIDPKKLQL